MSLKRSLIAKVDSPFSVPIGPAQFYLDDVKDIHEALLDFSHSYSRKVDSNAEEELRVEIRALDATADDIEDLKDATRTELNHVSLTLSTPKIRVDLWMHQAEIIAESNTSDVSNSWESLRDLPILARDGQSLFVKHWAVSLFSCWQRLWWWELITPLSLGVLTVLPQKASNATMVFLRP